MTTTLHSGPLGQKTVAFRNQVWNAQHPHGRDGASGTAEVRRAVSLPLEAVTARAVRSAPSLSTVDGGAR